jgi:hypothetical protein
MNYILFFLLSCATFITIVFCYKPSQTHDESGKKILPGRTRTRPWHHDEKHQNEQRANVKRRVG